MFFCINTRNINTPLHWCFIILSDQGERSLTCDPELSLCFSRVTLSLGSRSPSLRSGSPLQDGPWINNKARRVWGTRWRGSLVWGQRAPPANRVIANHRNLLLPQTSSRCAEETVHIHTHTNTLKLIVLLISQPIVFFRGLTPPLCLSGAPARLRPEQSHSHDEPRLWTGKN